MQRKPVAKKRKVPASGVAHDKHERLTQEHRRILESDMGYQEEIPVSQVESFSFSELYEKGGKNKHSEVFEHEKRLTKEEIATLRSPVIEGVTRNIDEIFAKRRQDALLEIAEEIPSTSHADKREHRHLVVEVPAFKPLEPQNQNDPTVHLQHLNHQQQMSLMICDLYNCIEDVFQLNHEFLQNAFHLEDFLKMMKHTGDTTMRQLAHIDDKTLDIVFPVDDFDVFFLWIRLELADTKHGIPKKLQLAKFYRNEYLLNGEDEELRSEVRIFLKSVSVRLLNRNYFHCPCKNI